MIKLYYYGACGAEILNKVPYLFANPVNIIEIISGMCKGDRISLNYTGIANCSKREDFADNIWSEYRDSVEESCETLESNLGQPCLPESLIIALAHWGIKRKLMDRAS